ncbi:MAG: heme-dependent oxidative N-demethylase subunit alpha family protein [Acidimicrobiales bacterium]
MTPRHLTPALLLSYAPDPERYRPLTPPSWLDEVDLSATSVPARMGTRALPEESWLLPDHLAADELRLRRRLLAEQRDHVFACTRRAEEPAREVGRLVDRWLATHRAASGPGADGEDGEGGEGGEGHPLARAGTRVQEDLCLMVHHENAWRLEGAVLCFPSLWLLHEKLGRPTAVVHGPVPHYATELSRRVDSLLDRLPPGKVVWRRNVSVWPALLLWAPCHRLDPALCTDAAPVDGVPPLWIRSERQTLRRLPDTGAIVFTIRVQTVPIAVLAQRPDRARDLAAWYRAPIGAARRGQLGPRMDGLLGWLDQVAGDD